MRSDGGTSRLLGAVAFVAGAFAAGEAVATSPGFAQLAWFLAAILAALIVNATVLGPVAQLDTVDPGELLRMRSRERSLQELAAAEVFKDTIGELIPIERPRVPPSTVARFVTEFATGTSQPRLVVAGPAGSGKSTLLHRAALALNQATDGRIAVVVPLGAYDWAREKLVDWLATEVAQGTGVKERDVRTLLAQERLLLLLDGIETVPTRAILESQGLPVSELPFFDRLMRRGGVRPIDPRVQLIARLAKLSAFLVAVRSDALEEPETLGLRAYPVAKLGAIPRATAMAELRTAAGSLPPDAARALKDAVQSPLYLRLASEVCGEHGLLPPSGSREQTEAWLWDRHLDIHLASREARELGWEASAFRRWLASYAAAVMGQDAMSFRRWPLLYGPRLRLALRAARSAASAALAGALALLFATPAFALVVTALTFPLFLLAGEGAATRPLAPQSFGAKRFLREVGRHWNYGFSFAFGGALIGWLIANWDGVLRVSADASQASTVLTGAVAGVLLGLIVPSLYELSYLDDAALYGQRYRAGTTRATLLSSVTIGVTAGLIVALALEVAFPTQLVFLAIPICVGLALLDTLGLPSAAVLLWALQRRGPLRAEAFLAEATDLQLRPPLRPVLLHRAQ